MPTETEAAARRDALVLRRLEFLAGDIARMERPVGSVAGADQAVKVANALASLLESVAPVSGRLAARVDHYARTAAGDEGRQLRQVGAGLRDASQVLLAVAEDLRVGN